MMMINKYNQSGYNFLPLLIHLKMHQFPSEMKIMEEEQDAFLAKVDVVEVAVDLGGAILNNLVSLMLIVWMLPL